MTDATDVALEKAKSVADEVFPHWRERCPFDIHYLVEAAIEAYQAALPKGELAERLVNMAVDVECKRGIIADRNLEQIAADLRAAASLLGGDVPEGWQPIETAPKDGTRILLAKIVGHLDHPTALWWAIVGMWSEKWNNWNDGIEPCGLAGPTHWMPISAHGVGIAARPPESGRE